MAFGGETTALLQPLAQFGVAPALAVYRLSAVAFALTIRGKVDDAQVNPKHTVNCLLVRLRHVTDCQQIERATVVGQIAFTLARLQQRALMLACAVGDVLAARERPNRYGVEFGIPRQVAVVEGKGAMRLERALGLPIQLVCIGNFSNTANEDLRAQAEGGFTVVVDEFLERVPSKLTRLPCDSTNRITGGIRFGQSCQECRVLFRRGVQFDLRDKLHTR